MANPTALNVSAGWDHVFEGESRRHLETVDFPGYLMKQRWFGGKSRHIQSTRIVDWAAFNASHSALVLVKVQFDGGLSDVYFVPLGMNFGAAADELRQTAPNAIAAPIVAGKAPGLLHDGILDDETCLELLSLIADERELHTHHGRIRGVRGMALHDFGGRAGKGLRVRRGSAEQSNTSILYGDQFILKTFRRLEPGMNPDAEIGRYLTERTGFDRIPPFAGLVEYESDSDRESSTLAMLQGLVANGGDGWEWTLEELNRYFEACAPLPFPTNSGGEAGNPKVPPGRPVPESVWNHLRLYLDSAATLGRRTGELHRALASSKDDPGFTPEPLTEEDVEALLAGLHQHASRIFDALAERMPYLPNEVVGIASAVVSRRRHILGHFETLKLDSLRPWRIRVHGDYHLGQILKVNGDFVILDFEGEPARSLADRRAKQCPLKDVAGMLRSFSYAAQASLINYATRHPAHLARLEPWADFWERSVGAEFLRAYWETTRNAEFLPTDSGGFRRLLDAFLIDKAIYEVLYELNARPAWVRIPLMGILSLDASWALRRAALLCGHVRQSIP